MKLFTRINQYSSRSAAVALSVVACTLGLTPLAERADAAPTVSLVSQLTLPGTTNKSDIIVYRDQSNNKEYVIIGQFPSIGTDIHIVDVTNPVSPSLVKTVSGVPGFDLKVWRHYLYLCDGNSTGTDSQIWDIIDPLNPTFEGYFPSCHNITIDEVGNMYLSYSTLRIYELRTDPTAPTFVWTDALIGGHDATVVGNRLYDFHGYDGTFIYDISNVYSPVLLGSIGAGSGITYHHSGWPSASGEFLYICDELGNAVAADISVWDISNPALPVKKDEYIDPNATVHNAYRIGNYLYTSFYVAGFRVFDVSTPSAITLADEFDTSASTGNGVYEGAWGCDPFSPTGYIYISDMQNGLYVFTFGELPTAIPEDSPTNAQFVLHQNYPNPFNPTTTITYDLLGDGDVSLVIFDGLGRTVRTLVDRVQSAGPKSVTWDSADDIGRKVSSGVYFYRLQAGGTSHTKRMILLK